jgi:hypothetical protein
MTMNTPGFTAEDSLHATRGHYRTSTRPLGLPAHTVGTIRLSEIDVPGEVIEIEDDAPWSPPSWGGHTGPGTTSPPPETGGGEPGGGSDGGATPEDSGGNSLPFSRGCSVDQDQSPAGRSCLSQFDVDVGNGVPRRYRHYLKCTGKAKGGVQHPKVECCQLKRVGGKIQEVCDQMTFV